MNPNPFTQCSNFFCATCWCLGPLAHESGTSVRGRAQIGHGGHVRLRTALYLATLNAARFNPIIKTHFEGLRATGKPPKVARCVAACKLLHLAYAW